MTAAGSASTARVRTVNVAPALEAQQLEVFTTQRGDGVSITNPIDLYVMPGESVAVVGESGSGKSLMVRAMLDLLPEGVRAQGSALVDGRDVRTLSGAALRAMRGNKLAFVMQDPFTMLNPLDRCGRQITAALRTASGTRLPRRQRHAEAIRRLAEVGITDPTVADRYPFELSGGMRQRVAIAAAIAENPTVLIADEPTTALDVTSEREVLGLLDRLRKTHRMGLVLVTHDLRIATAYCDRVYVMYAGSLVETAPSAEFARQPRHPYTAGLLRSEPPLDRRVATLPSMAGSVPRPGSRPHGCRFAPRCAWVEDACTKAEPPLVTLGNDRAVRCRRADDISPSDAAPDPAQSSTAPAPRRSNAGAIIALRNVQCRYASKTAVAGVDLDVFPGESVGLVGESGSGKTTLARLMVGLARPSAGSVRVGSVELGAGPVRRKDWEAVRSTAQIAFQDPSSTLNPSRSIGSVLRETLRLVSPRDVDRRLIEVLELVGLDPAYTRRRPSQLSGGERQRVAIARALAREPQVLICDEIVSALDVSVQARVLNLLTDLQRRLGLAYVFITHDLAVARQVTDRLYVLKDGVVVESGETGQVLSGPAHAYTRLLVASVPSSARPKPDPDV